MDVIVFEPWKGENYKTGGIFGKKILVIGNSHYCDAKMLEKYPACRKAGRCLKNCEGCANYTKDAICDHLEGCGHPIYGKIEAMLYRCSGTDKPYKDVWNSIAYYNYIQQSLVSGSSHAAKDLYDESEQAFWQVLEDLRPSYIIALGKSAMWTYMSGASWTLESPIEYEREKVNCGIYTLSDGTPIHAIWVLHPSAFGKYHFCPSYWNHVLNMWFNKKTIDFSINQINS
ncbi:MAG: hypothetical protein SPD11_05560 [Sphaerochaetaceae bacterium]|nr:hypothetical protein [Sphaerochaetaceae bacterium]